MNILYIAQTYHPKIGGAERYIDRLAQYMALRGHEVYVLAPPYDGEELKRDYKVIRMDFRDGWKRGIFYYLRAIPMESDILKIVAKNDIDVVHYQYINPFGVFSGRIRRHGARTFATIHGSGFIFMREDWLGKHLLRYSLHHLDGVIGVSDYCASLALKEGAPEERVHVVYNATDPDIFRPRPDEVDHTMILVVSRLVPRKDIPTLLKALVRVRKTIPGAHVVIAGDGPERKNLENMARDIGLGESVEFLGFVSDDRLRELYASAGVFVLPAIYDESGKDIEGFGIVLLEAMASGRPVIGARVGGIPSAVKPEWGHLYTPGDDEDLAEKIIDILSDSGRADEMGRAGRRAVENIYNWNHVAERMEAIYDSG